MFGSDNLVYTPQNQRLILDDVYRWQRFEFDIHHFGLRMRSTAFDDVSLRMRAFLETVSASPRFEGNAEEIAAEVNAALAGLASLAGGLEGEFRGTLRDVLGTDEGAWWVRIGDIPAETFHPDDYERAITQVANPRAHLLYGHVGLSRLEGSEIELPGDEEGLPFALDIPAQDGTTRVPIPVLEPLPLIDEFCGTNGVSARGRTVNINARGEVSASHEFCTPLGTIEGGLFATLYLHLSQHTIDRVAAPLKRPQLARVLSLLERSHFKLANEGNLFRIYERDGDVIHLYDGVEGKESEGSHTMPPFMLVAQSGGLHDAALRADLLEATESALAGGG